MCILYLFRFLSDCSHCSCHFATRVLPAYTGKAAAGRLKLNCFDSAVGYSRAGGDGVCIDDLSFVWCARSGRGRCALFPVGRCQAEDTGLE